MADDGKRTERFVVGGENLYMPTHVTSLSDSEDWDWENLRPIRHQFVAERKSPKTVFVAYPYSFSKNDYRDSFSAVGEEFGISFLYADEQITNKQILDKIRGMIEQSVFSIFDVTTWNPNVALELGIAVGLDEDYYILFDPTRDQTEVPSDLGGIDRLQYEDFSSLKDELRRLMEQQFGSPGEDATGDSSGESFNDVIEALRDQVPRIVEDNPGIQMGGIATQIGVPIEFAQNITRPLLDSGQLETRGQRRGTRYYTSGAAPAEADDAEADGGEREAPEGSTPA